MPSPPEATVANGLIAALPTRVRHSLLRQVETVELASGSVLCEQGERYHDAYFPLTSRLSQVALVPGHPPLQVGQIGSEGMLGATLLLGFWRAPLRAVVQGSGSAWRLGAAALRHELRNSRALRDALGRHLFLHIEHLAQGAACARFHEVEPRLARCLLMVNDQARNDGFQLTHQQLADILGVQRSAVTLAAGALQRAGMIRYSRGRIDIRCRVALEAASCSCYAAGIAAQARPA
jgi:CRP-like cAMP-binding protein